MTDTEARTVLALDASLRRTGFAVARNGRLTDYGCLTTDDRTDEGERLRQIWQQLWKLIRMYDVDEVALEACFLGRNTRTLQALSRVHGVILLVAAMAGIPVSQYPPAVVKQAVTGKGNSTKETVAAAVQALFGEVAWEKVKRPGFLDVTDALAVLYTHFQSQPDQPGDVAHVHIPQTQVL